MLAEILAATRPAEGVFAAATRPATSTDIPAELRDLVEQYRALPSGHSYGAVLALLIADQLADQLAT
ncbi:hypothetical protein [Streptosporangium roseum]|uniref:hypothetical protein n=1 Tax=Streptosporangium roseum TaxID=2001 RepID=UPI00332FD900